MGGAATGKESLFFTGKDLQGDLDDFAFSSSGDHCPFERLVMQETLRGRDTNTLITCFVPPSSHYYPPQFHPLSNEYYLQHLD